eukprot:2134133-Rhodomonas_salina.1
MSGTEIAYGGAGSLLRRKIPRSAPLCPVLSVLCGPEIAYGQREGSSALPCAVRYCGGVCSTAVVLWWRMVNGSGTEGQRLLY